MDDATFLALALTLTVLGAVGTWLAYRRRGLPAGMLGAGLTLLAPAAYLTDSLRMLTRVVDAVGDWATGLVFSPSVWVGVVLAGLAVLLVVGSRSLAARRAGRPSGAGSRRAAGARADEVDGTGRRPAVGRAKDPQAGPAVADDDDLADIEALLKRRGIS